MTEFVIFSKPSHCQEGAAAATTAGGGMMVLVPASVNHLRPPGPTLEPGAAPRGATQRSYSARSTVVGTEQPSHVEHFWQQHRTKPPDESWHPSRIDLTYEGLNNGKIEEFQPTGQWCIGGRDGDTQGGIEAKNDNYVLKGALGNMTVGMQLGVAEELDQFVKPRDLSETDALHTLKQGRSWAMKLSEDAYHTQNREGSRFENLRVDEALKILDSMVELPSIEDWICISRKEKSYAETKHVHAHICNTGLDAHRAIGNCIALMFLECGSVDDASQVFQKLTYRYDHAWNKLIIKYTQREEWQLALTMYERAWHELVSFSSYTLVALLKACSRLKDIEVGRQLHSEVIVEEYEDNLTVSNTLISFYSSCGLLSEARDVLDSLPARDVVSWTALITGYGEHGPGQEAVVCFEQMQEEGISPNSVTIVCVLKACGNAGALNKGRQIYKSLLKKGFEMDKTVKNTLIGMYAKCGSLLEAQDVFDSLPVKDVVSWTALISGYAEHGFCSDALDCLRKMQLQGIPPDAVAFASTLKACGTPEDLDTGRELHMEVLCLGLDKDYLVANTLVGIYTKSGSLLEAQSVFNKLLVRDAISWNTLIDGYANHGSGEEALNCFKNMQLTGISPDAASFTSSLRACSSMKALDKVRDIHRECARTGYHKDLLVGNTLISVYAKLGALSEAQLVFESLCTRDVVSWNALIGGCAEQGLGLEALGWFDKMQIEGACYDSVTLACILKACGSMGDIGRGQRIHLDLIEKGFDIDHTVCNSLVDMYASCGALFDAQVAFNKASCQDAVSWTALITGYVEHSNSQKALACYEDMQEMGIPLDPITYSCVLKACGSVGSLHKGHEMHTIISQKGLESDPSVGNGLISMYCKCGSLMEAQAVFENLPVCDVAAWSSMINGYGMNNLGNQALLCFGEMQRQGVSPDGVTFTCLLNACSQAGLMSEGLGYFKRMYNEYDLSPTIEHYTCIVDLVSSSGYVYEAERFVEMLCSTSETVWAALLTACKTYGEVELGLRCFQQLIKTNSKDATWYVLMADIYASADRWDDVYRIEDMRRRAGAKKKAAIAWIEVNNEVHEFVVGSDKSQEVSSQLRTMSRRMKEEGHLPDVGLVLKPISHDDKEAALCEHAERVAIAFGLLNTPQGTTLRVSKNLKMCNDCHSASKVISKIERRDIIIRDSRCIHQFKDGLCSCDDLL